MKIAVYSGSFDPVTKGHKDIIIRASKMCDRLIVVVLNNSSKNYIFNLQERKELVEKSFSDYENVEVVSYEGLLIDYMKTISCNYIIRGLRAVNDYEYELSMAYANYDISNSKIETIFIPASREFLYLSSSVVREIAKYNGELDRYLDKFVIESLKSKLKGK